MAGFREFIRKELLLVLTLAGVIFGVILGIIVNASAPSKTAIVLLGFPGEILMRLLKMMVLPLIAGATLS